MTPKTGFTNTQELIFDLLDFTPGALQNPLLQSKHRFIQITGGVRAGKSTLSTKILWSRRDFNKKQRFGLLGADYRMTTSEFNMLSEDAQRMGIWNEKGSSRRVDPGQITLTDGTIIETLTGKDPQTVAMHSYDGIIMCEAAQCGVELYHRAQERVAESRGWIVMSGTLEGSLGWYSKMHGVWLFGNEEHQSFSLPSWSNEAVFPGGRQDPEILRLESEMSEQSFLERIAGVPCPPRGLVFPEFRPDIHVRDVEWAGEETPVYIWEDPGYGTGSAHAILAAQIIDGQVQIFDEIYEQGIITQDLIGICQKRPWWKSPKQLVCDPHYKDQHHSMGSVAEVWLKETRLVAGGERVAILPGIERLKSFLKVDALTGMPGIVVNPRCLGLLSELGAAPHPFPGPNLGETCAYRWKMDRDGRVVGETPEDKFNHSLKAISYGLVYKFGYAGALTPQTVQVVRNWAEPTRLRSRRFREKNRV